MRTGSPTRWAGGVVDSWIGFPTSEPWASLAPLRAQLREPPIAPGRSVAAHLFGEHAVADDADPVQVTLGEMDRHGIEIGIVQLATEAARRAVRDHPDRFAALLPVDANDLRASVEAIRLAHAEHDIRGVYVFPAGSHPQVAVDDRRAYPIYQVCADLDLAVVVNAGVAGPRVPSWSQHVVRFEPVAYDFPDLTIVMCHGAEPWDALAVKLLVKWPGLHFMTSAYAPKHYPRPIVEYANSGGVDKVLYAGYYPFGLTLDRIFAELSELELRDAVWPKFLRENARRVFRL